MKASIEDFPPPNLGSGVSRSNDTLHLTAIMRSLASDLSLMTLSENDPTLNFEMGFTWEYLLERAWGRRLIGNRWPEYFNGYGKIERPREVSLDGIVGSPDGFTVFNKVKTVLEYKLTKKSAFEFDFTNTKKHWWWQTQSKAYCQMLGCRHCHFFICFINGDYRTERDALHKRVPVEYSQTELDENWAMLKSYAEKRGWLK